MGMCVGKFLEIQSVCESLVWYMENAKRKIKLYARMKLLLNMYTRETDFAFATVYFSSFFHYKYSDLSFVSLYVPSLSICPQTFCTYLFHPTPYIV